MQIKTIYQMCTLEALKSPRQYIHTRKQTQSLPIKPKKRETFLKEIEKLSKQSPGPGMYITNPQDAKLSKIVTAKVDFKKVSLIPKKTFLDQLIKKKNKVPSVGRYEIQLDHTQEVRKKYSFLGDKARKQAKQFKSTIFDGYNTDVLKVDPACYTTLKPMGCPKKFQALKTPPPPQPIQPQGKLKKSQSLPKIPGPQSYTPIPSNYNTFDMLSSRRSLNENNSYKKNKAKKKRINQQQMSPGPKYNLIAQWSPKNKDIIKNLFKSTKNLMPRSVYH